MHGKTLTHIYDHRPSIQAVAEATNPWKRSHR